MPEETEEERRAAIRKKMAEEAEKAAQAEGKDDKKAKKKEEKKAKKAQDEKPAEEDEKKEEEKKEPPKPVKVWLYQTSIYDLLASLEKMKDYDYMMRDLGVLSADLEEEMIKSGDKEKPQSAVSGGKSDLDRLQAESQMSQRPPTQTIRFSDEEEYN